MKINLRSVGIYYRRVSFARSSEEFLDYLHEEFFPVVDDEINNDSDFILLITGAERTGKSNLSLVIAKEYLEHHGYRLRRIDSSIMGIRVSDALPMLKERLEELKRSKKTGAPISPRVYIIDEGAQFYSKWRQMTKESYEVFLIYRLMGFARIFWMLNYQSLLDAGELFKTGRADAWFYTFMDRNKKRYVAVIPDKIMRSVFVKMRIYRRYRALVDLAHQFPKLLFERVLRIKDLSKSKIMVFESPKFTDWDVYLDYKIRYNEERIVMLEKYLKGDELPSIVNFMENAILEMQPFTKIWKEISERYGYDFYDFYARRKFLKVYKQLVTELELSHKMVLRYIYPDLENMLHRNNYSIRDTIEEIKDKVLRKYPEMRKLVESKFFMVKIYSILAKIKRKLKK